MIGFEEGEEFGKGFRVLGTFSEVFKPVRVLPCFWVEGIYLETLAGMFALVIPLVMIS